tara:strand:- start:485 stop:1321 length:837 start_codon:yes stop_codon:yes gene_type:complete
MISTKQFNKRLSVPFNEEEAVYLLNTNMRPASSISQHDSEAIRDLWNETMKSSLHKYHEQMKSFTKWLLYRYDIINHLIKKFDYQNYLEIGIRDGKCFSKINITHKDAVDPEPVREGKELTNYPISSDDFFNFIKDHDIKYDIIFIDGLHHDYQVYNDICNALKHLNLNGTIVCHDMNPLYFVTGAIKRSAPGVSQWNGDCWKAWAKLRTENPDITMEVINTDHGVGIIRKGTQQLFEIPDKSLLNIYDGSATWQLLETHRKELLNLITVDEFLNKYD